MDNSCKPIPILPVDRFGMPLVSSDCDNDQVARKFHDEISRKTVLIEIGDTPAPRQPYLSKVGSGSFVDDGQHVVTNVHVALSGKYVDVITTDGNRYGTEVEKIDPMNDLAELKVIGMRADPSRALKIDATPPQKDEEFVTYGHPGGLDEVWASPGTFKGKDKFEKLVPDPDDFPDMKEMIKLKTSPDPVIAKEAKLYLEAERLQQRANIRNGNSGGPSIDAAGNLRMVAADRVSNGKSLFIGGDKVKALVDNPEKTFNFNYEVDAQGHHKLASITRKDGTDTPPIVLKKPEEHAKADDLVFERLYLTTMDYQNRRERYNQSPQRHVQMPDIGDLLKNP